MLPAVTVFVHITALQNSSISTNLKLQHGYYGILHTEAVYPPSVSKIYFPAIDFNASFYFKKFQVKISLLSFINFGVSLHDLKPLHYSSIYSNSTTEAYMYINLLHAELNPICHLLALLGAHLIFHVSRIRVKISLYTQWNPSSFDQSCDHLQGCKIQSLDTFKKVQNEIIKVAIPICRCKKTIIWTNSLKIQKHKLLLIMMSHYE